MREEPEDGSRQRAPLSVGAGKGFWDQEGARWPEQGAGRGHEKALTESHRKPLRGFNQKGLDLICILKDNSNRNQMWHAHTMGYYSALKSGNSDTSYNLKDTMLNVISQSQEDNYCVNPLIGGTQSTQVSRDRK